MCPNLIRDGAHVERLSGQYSCNSLAEPASCFLLYREAPSLMISISLFAVSVTMDVSEARDVLISVSQAGHSGLVCGNAMPLITALLGLRAV